MLNSDQVTQFTIFPLKNTLGCYGMGMGEYAILGGTYALDQYEDTKDICQWVQDLFHTPDTDI